MKVNLLGFLLALIAAAIVIIIFHFFGKVGFLAGWISCMVFIYTRSLTPLFIQDNQEDLSQHPIPKDTSEINDLKVTDTDL